MVEPYDGKCTFSAVETLVTVQAVDHEPVPGIVEVSVVDPSAESDVQVMRIFIHKTGVSENELVGG